MKKSEKQLALREKMQHFVLVDLGFGDQGKGTMTDYLVRLHSAGLVVRYCGGAQAAHNVFDEQGRHFTFSQFGSGTLAGAKTLLSKHMLVNPLTMRSEAKDLRSKFGFVSDKLWQTVFVDERALVTTPYHRALNRLRELSRGDGRHGSCGMGIGETVAYSLEYGADAVIVGDLRDKQPLQHKLELCRRRLSAKASQVLLADDARHRYEVAEQIKRELSTFDVAADHVCHLYADFAASGISIVSPCEAASMVQAETCVFEGGQGVLLDENYGFHPYTTWATTTSANAKAILEEAGVDDYEQIGVLRAYATRHGPGPFPTYSAELSRVLPEAHNGMDFYQREFRRGWFDLPMTEYALKANGPVDGLAITHVDTLPKRDRWNIAIEYDQPLVLPANLEEQAAQTARLKDVRCTYVEANADNVVPFIESALGTPVRFTSHGPLPQDKQALREGVCNGSIEVAA